MMSLREEHSEQNDQSWRAHFERERRDLSASVEAALIDNGVLTQQWQDELDEQDTPQSITGGTELVPPRLSLQSKPLPTIRPENTFPPATDSHPIISSVTTTPQQYPTPPSQQAGILARLAKRFTSSFAAVKPETQQPIPPHEPLLNHNSETNYPPLLSDDSRFSIPAPQPDLPLVRVIDTIAPSHPEDEKKHNASRQQHSLKRNAKVRLETAEWPAIMQTAPSPQREEPETGAILPTTMRDAAHQQQGKPVLPVQNAMPDIAHSSSLHSSTPASLSGSGIFESGQSDAMIANSHITASSVVLVTLTTNPGPVVAQYISLQPQIGFTVHLTAPVNTRTTFNYVIVLGETV